MHSKRVSDQCTMLRCIDCAGCDHRCHPPQEETLFEPVRPYSYKGAGWSGTDTSEAGEPARGERQRQILAFVRSTRYQGATSHEVEAALNLDHGKVSGPLSILHRKSPYLVLLREKRDGFRVYVTPDNAGNRDYE